MLEISKPHLVFLVLALNDAVKYNEALLNSETIKDVSDGEEHLLCLENFQLCLEAEYKKRQKNNPDLLPYDQILGKKVE